MKKTYLILASALCLMASSCKEDAASKITQDKVTEAADRDIKSEDLPIMTFEETEHDFGVINEGDVVEHKFKFTNTGKSPLVISSAKGSCGCTVPSFPKEPVAPGESAEMLVKFSSSGKPNMQQKTVTITANTAAGKERIKIKAKVTPDPEKQKQRDENARKAREQREKAAAEK